MNISPINIVNFKYAAYKNNQNSKVNGNNVTSPISINASQEALKAYYCPQISFCARFKKTEEKRLLEKI